MSKTTILAFSLFWFAVVTVYGETVTNSNSKLLFQFKFQQNKPLIYAVDFKTWTMNDTHAGQRSSLTSNSTHTRYKIKLSASGTNQDGTTAVYYEPYDFEQDLQATGPKGQVDTSIRGLQITSKQNGIVMVDSVKGIGMSELQMLKQAAYGHLLCGYFDFDPAGHITKFEGDLPFVDVWQNELRFGLNNFYLCFPTNQIAVHDSWTNRIALKSFGSGIVFNGDGIVQPWVFSRESDESTTNGLIACFALYESDSDKDMSGYFDQPGQQTRVVVPEHNENMSATFRFDRDAGCLLSMKKSDKSRESLSMVVQGTAAESRMDSSLDISITLINR